MSGTPFSYIEASLLKTKACQIKENKKGYFTEPYKGSKQQRVNCCEMNLLFVE